jgi:hypothetical protein
MRPKYRTKNQETRDNAPIALNAAGDASPGCNATIRSAIVVSKTRAFAPAIRRKNTLNHHVWL